MSLLSINFLHLTVSEILRYSQDKTFKLKVSPARSNQDHTMILHTYRLHPLTNVASKNQLPTPFNQTIPRQLPAHPDTMCENNYLTALKGVINNSTILTTKRIISKLCLLFRNLREQGRGVLSCKEIITATN